MSPAEMDGLPSMMLMPVMAAIGCRPRSSPYSAANRMLAGCSRNALGSSSALARNRAYSIFASSVRGSRTATSAVVTAGFFLVDHAVTFVVGVGGHDVVGHRPLTGGAPEAEPFVVEVALAVR